MTFKCGMLIAAALAFGSLVHVAAVFANMPIVVNITGLYDFSMYAFTNTGIMVQSLMVVSVLVAVWLIWDIVRKIQFGTFTLSHT